MGQTSSKLCCCFKFRKVAPDTRKQLKEVFIWFIILDYLPLVTLTRIGRVSRGIYWLSGNQLILNKFTSPDRPLTMVDLD
jgi:hypothetical protein